MSFRDYLNALADVGPAIRERILADATHDSNISTAQLVELARYASST